MGKILLLMFIMGIVTPLINGGLNAENSSNGTTVVLKKKPNQTPGRPLAPSSQTMSVVYDQDIAELTVIFDEWNTSCSVVITDASLQAVYSGYVSSTSPTATVPLLPGEVYTITLTLQDGSVFQGYLCL